MLYETATANPLGGNPLRTRADLAKAVNDLFEPLLPYFSSGKARVRLSATAASFDRAAADLEGFARPLWGLVPLAAGGGRFAHWERYREGLANGTDPKHPEYWGMVNRKDQRLVEMAAIGLALRMVPQHVWEPLPQRTRDNIAAYLTEIRTCEYSNNNWKFFRVLVDLGLEEVGISYDRSLTERFLEELDAFYIGDGWYRDGDIRRIDHYIPFAMHYYGLIYAQLARGDEARKAAYRERAAAFARDIRHWFDEEGGALAFGRSLTYRFACGGFWGALAFADLEAVPWGEAKGHLLRHLRWWANKPIADRDGVLSVGYAYPNLLMSESYNSAGSPYWAMKAFLPLALPDEHPFWQAEELPFAPEDAPVALRHPGMVMLHTTKNVVALSSGQQNWEMRFGAEKYAKFVYSSRYAFSVEGDERAFKAAAFDGAIGFTDDGRHYRARESNEVALIAGTRLYARWKPWSDVTVDTWLVPAAPWHVRIHRIDTPRPLQTREGGFAVARADADADTLENSGGRAVVRAEADLSAILDLGTVPRAGLVQRTLPNTNLMHARALVPQLVGDIPAGTTILACAVLALPAGAEADAALAAPPPLPDLAELEALFARDGVAVSAIQVPETF